MDVNYFDFMSDAKRVYSRYLDPVCRQWGLTRNELDVILFLANNPNYDRAADIVALRGISKSHVSLSVSTLESKGLLVREMDPDDRRTVHLKLKADAYFVAEAGRQAQKRFMDCIHAGITEEEMQIWRGMALRIRNNMRNME